MGALINIAKMLRIFTDSLGRIQSFCLSYFRSRCNWLVMASPEEGMAKHCKKNYWTIAILYPGICEFLVTLLQSIHSSSSLNWNKLKVLLGYVNYVLVPICFSLLRKLFLFVWFSTVLTPKGMGTLKANMNCIVCERLAIHFKSL